MRIGCVTRHPYPSDQEIRVTKFSAALRSAGHEVWVICPGVAGNSPRDAFADGDVIRLTPGRYGALGSVLAPLPVNPIWIAWLWRQFGRLRLDLVIVRDLRLALPAFIAARLRGIKTILDLGEHYPGLMEVAGKQRLAHYLIRNRWLVEKLEALSVRMADAVWVVVDENRERLREQNANIEVINNYPPLDSAQSTSMGRRPSTPGAPITLISLGLIDNIRGLGLALDALAIVVRDHPRVRLVIFGDGDFRPTLEAQVRSLRLQEHVEFRGWVTGEKKYEAMAEGDIGILLHRVCDLTQHTLPNKLFDYMSIGLPVLATRMRPVARVLEAERCGICVDETPESVAEGIGYLIKDTEARLEMGENGRRSVSMRYRWSDEVDKLLRSVDFVADRRA